ncbi:MAG: hypothetical protein IT501_05500 [Rubrivivax sp.]|nr:hypothetical protein [Rubrivivax sp.]
MLRCAALGLSLCMLLGAPIASAQVARLFPPTALRGELVGVAPPDVLLDGKPARLAPGARIRNEDNRFEVMGQISGRKLLVHYTTDAGGQLLDIWILRPSEIANQPWPMTREQAARWVFDPIAQTWSRP